MNNIVTQYIMQGRKPEYLLALNQIQNPGTQLKSTKECVDILNVLFETINEVYYEVPIKDTFLTKNTMHEVLLGIIICDINDYTCHNKTLKLISNLSLKDAQLLVDSLINAIQLTTNKKKQ